MLQVYKSRMIFITSCLLDVNALKLSSKNTAVIGFWDEGYYMMDGIHPCEKYGWGSS